MDLSVYIQGGNGCPVLTLSFFLGRETRRAPVPYFVTEEERGKCRSCRPAHLDLAGERRRPELARATMSRNELKMIE